MSSDAPQKGLSLDVINSIDLKKAWSTLRQMHVQFVLLPHTENKSLIDNLNYRLIKKDEQGVALIEVLDDGKILKDKGGLSGDGYFNYIEHAGRISFFPTKMDAITIPVRFDDGWHISSGASRIFANAKKLISVLPNSTLDLIEIYYFPKNFLALLIFGPISLLISLLFLQYSKHLE